jgi:hypothetical protein
MRFAIIVSLLLGMLLGDGLAAKLHADDGEDRIRSTGRTTIVTETVEIAPRGGVVQTRGRRHYDHRHYTPRFKGRHRPGYKCYIWREGPYTYRKCYAPRHHKPYYKPNYKRHYKKRHKYRRYYKHRGYYPDPGIQFHFRFD